MNPVTTQHMSLELVDGVAVVRLLDVEIFREEQIYEIRDGLFSLVDDGGYKKILLDLSRCELIVSLGLWQLIRLRARLLKAGGELRLCGLTPLVAEAMKITGFDKILAIDVDQAGALARF